MRTNQPAIKNHYGLLRKCVTCKQLFRNADGFICETCHVKRGANEDVKIIWNYVKAWFFPILCIWLGNRFGMELQKSLNVLPALGLAMGLLPAIGFLCLNRVPKQER